MNRILIITFESPYQCSRSHYSHQGHELKSLQHSLLVLSPHSPILSLQFYYKFYKNSCRDLVVLFARKRSDIGMRKFMVELAQHP